MVSSDDWLSPTNINQLIEALDNLVSIWVLMWPGKWSMVSLRRAVTFAIGYVQNADLPNKMLEAFINEALTSNSSFAARGKPPMEFEKLDKLAAKYLDNEKHFEKSFKISDTKEKSPTIEVFKDEKSIGNLKSTSGKTCFLYFNTTMAWVEV